eukprot:g12451.t1
MERQMARTLCRTPKQTSHSQASWAQKLPPNSVPATAVLRVALGSMSTCKAADLFPFIFRPRMKSMVQEKKEASDNARRHRLAVHDKKMLGDCVRLVDYMFQACLAKVVINAAVEFFQRVDSSSKMFSISVAFGEKNMVFDPCLEDFLEMLTKLWRASVQVVNGIPSLLSEAHYAKHLVNGTANSQTVESILNNNWQFNHYTAAVRERIQADINTAQKFSDKHFELFRRIHDYGNSREALLRGGMGARLASFH